MGRTPAPRRAVPKSRIAMVLAAAAAVLFLLLATPPAAPGLSSSPADGAPPSAAAAPDATGGGGGGSYTATRFYIDEGYFMDGETEILRAYISASGGRMEISGESSAAFLSIKGYYVPDKWDVYITMRQACHMAFPHMRPGQRANCIPGVRAITLKKEFVQSWQEAYGELAFGYIPRSYLLPEQYWVWRSHMLQARSPPESKWVLKANVHRGKGVSVAEKRDAVARALAPGDAQEGDGAYRHILVQNYLNPQMVIGGRSSYLRLWLLVTSVTPLRAYLFKGGVAIFGKQRGGPTSGNATGLSAAGAAGKGSGGAASSGSGSGSTGSSGGGNGTAGSDDLIVNLWIQDREKSPIWSLAKLGAYLDDNPGAVVPLPGGGPEEAAASSSGGGARRLRAGRRRTFADAWADMRASASLALAAALPAMRAEAANASAPRNGMFEYFGLDFVLDAHLRPYMLEVNAVPSMARRARSGCAGLKVAADCRLVTQGAAAAAAIAGGAGGLVDGFDEQKEVFVHDMLKILGLPVDPTEPPKGGGGGGGGGADALRAAAHAAGYREARGGGEAAAGGGGGGGAGAAVEAAAAVRRRRRAARALAAATSAADIPEPLRGVMCGAGTGAGPAAAAAAGSEAAPFACVRCLAPSDLAALADVEAELDSIGRFEPVHDLLLAHAVSAAAAAAAGPAPAGGAVAGGAGAAGAAAAAARPAAPPRLAGGGGQAHRVRPEFLQDDVSAWQKLRGAWQQEAPQGNSSAADLEVMRYFTTDARLPPAKGLGLNGLDYVMSAWLRVWQEAKDGGGGGGGDAGLRATCSSGGGGSDRGGGAIDPCLLARLNRLISHCYL